MQQGREVESFAKLIAQTVRCDGDIAGRSLGCTITPPADGKPLKLIRPTIEWSLLGPLFDKLGVQNASPNAAMASDGYKRAARAVSLVCAFSISTQRANDLRPAERELCFLYREATRSNKWENSFTPSIPVQPNTK
ncbi:MAG: hypothetical protein AAF127_13465 [Pseudomonadota bacterium]